jgi:uncharacterized membrane protein
MTSTEALRRAASKTPTVPAILTLIVAAAAVARFTTLDQQSFTSDEAVTVRLVKMSFGDMLAELPDSERTPPLYYVLAWVWARLSGTGQVGLRALSAALGTVTIPIVFLAARRLLSPAAALVAAALAAANPLLFWYSQEARAYALYALLVAISLLFFARTLTDPSPRDRFGWGISSAAAVAAHYFAVFLVLPQAVWLLWRRRVRPLHLAVPAVTMLALLPLAVVQGAGGDQFGTGEQGRPLLAILKQLLVGLELDTGAETLLKVAGVVGLVIAAAAWRSATRVERAGVRVGAILAGACLVLPLAPALLGFSYLNARNLLGVVVPISIALGGAYTVARAQPLGAAGAALILGAGVASITLTLTDTFPQREDWRALARALGEERQALVVTPGDGKPYDAYPLRPYLDRVGALPAGGACVERIAVGALPMRGGRKVSWSAIGPRVAPAPSVPGFRLVNSESTDTFVLSRYRASAPRRVTSRELLSARRDVAEHGAALLIGAGGRGCQGVAIRR